MLGTLYTSLTGLLNFSKGLNVISNNVGNLNTPGFKGSNTMFHDTYYNFGLADNSSDQTASMQIGSGVQAGSTYMDFKEGQLQSTGNDLDVAINGNGFFILRQDGNVEYSRAGQFQIDKDGYLIDTTTKARIAGLDSTGGLTDINISGLNSSPAKPTSEVKFTNNLSTGATSSTLNNVQVYDSTGTQQTLTLVFTNNSSTTPGSWLVKVEDSTGATIANGEIRYQGDGSPETGYNTMSFTYTPKGANSTTIVLNFGDPGSFTGSTSFSGGSTSTIKVESQDGYGVGALSKTTFDKNGYLNLAYSNGQTVKNKQLALAWFENVQQLTENGSNTYTYNRDTGRTIAAPNSGPMGSIAGGQLELSNVDLTTEFTDMIVLQRGYQASSEIISITNQMIQQLMNMRSSTGG